MAQKKAYQGIDPFTVARRLGLNVPGWMSEGISPATLAGMLPGAAIKDSKDMGGQMAASRRLGNYGDMAVYGLGSAALAGSEILPGLLGSTARKGIKSGVKGLLGGKKKAPKKKASKKKKSLIQTANLRDMTTAEAIKAASKEPHLIKGPDGQYIGAPRGFKTKQRVNKQRKAFDAEVAAGADGGDWYERARDFNKYSQPDDRYLESLAADEQALWSAQANPDTNLGWAIDARNAYNAGKPLDKVRTGQQARSYIEARDAYDPMLGHNGGPPLDDNVGRVRLGKKTGIYGQHLDPNQPPATTGTNDIWHARQLGYTNADGGEFSRALTEQEHRYMDYETMLAVQRANDMKLGGRDDWTGAEIQAAPWVAGKGRALSERSGGKKTVAEGIAEASKTYPEYAGKYTVHVPHEQIPGKSTGLLSPLIDADSATKRAFTDEAQWVDSKGRDRLLDETLGGGYVLPTTKGQGAYMNSAKEIEYNPVDVARPMSGFRVDEKTGVKRIPQEVVGALDSTNAVRGLLDFQEGVAWNKVVPSSKGPKTSFEMNIGRMPNKQEMKDVVKLADKYGVEIVANTDQGLAFRKFGQETRDLNKMLKGEFGQELRRIFPGMDVQGGKWAGDDSPIGAYFDLSEELAQAGTGAATMKVLNQVESMKDIAPKYYDNLMNSKGVQIKARENLERLDRWEKKLGGDQRADYRRMLQIVGDGKLKALRDYVKKYGPAGLPGIATLALFGGHQGEQKEVH